MDINEFLKRINKTKTELAPELGISRPTLNQYIELYEKGNDIENDRYNIIFQRLFSNPNMDREGFDRQLESIKYLLERDKRYDIGALDPGAADIVADVHDRMISDMSGGEWEKKVYDGILIVLSQYRIQPIMRELMGYFSDLNSDVNLDDIQDDSKAYYSYYYRVFREIVNTPPAYSDEEYKAFLKRREEISRERILRSNKKTESIRKKIDEILREVEDDYQKKGIDANETEVLSEMIRRIKGGN